MQQTSATPSIIAVVGGDARATGTDTLATGDVTNNIKSLGGGVTVASGEATFAAEGTGSGAQASAHSGVNLTGEDVAFELTINKHGGSSTDASAGSTTKYVAVDIPGWTPPGGPIVSDTVVNLPYAPNPSGGSGLSGNVAHNTVTVEGLTAGGLGVAVEAQAHAVGGHLSAVSAWALVAA